MSTRSKAIKRGRVQKVKIEKVKKTLDFSDLSIGSPKMSIECTEDMHLEEIEENETGNALEVNYRTISDVQRRFFIRLRDILRHLGVRGGALEESFYDKQKNLLAIIHEHIDDEFRADEDNFKYLYAVLRDFSEDDLYYFLFSGESRDNENCKFLCCMNCLKEHDFPKSRLYITRESIKSWKALKQIFSTHEYYFQDIKCKICGDFIAHISYDYDFTLDLTWNL